MQDSISKWWLLILPAGLAGMLLLLLLPTSSVSFAGSLPLAHRHISRLHLMDQRTSAVPLTEATAPLQTSTPSPSTPSPSPPALSTPESEIQQLVSNLTSNISHSNDIDSSVMMTIIDTQGSKVLLPLFLSSLCRVNAQLAKQLLIICVSAEAYEACQQTYATCMYDKAAEARNIELAKQPVGGENRVKSPLFLQIGWDKLDRLSLALQKGVHIFFVDSDIIWLSDPMPALQSNLADIQLTHDGWGPNIGVMYVRSTNYSLAFMENWLARRVAPDSRDQYEFQAAVDNTTQTHALQVAYVNKGQFPNGCCCGHGLPQDRRQAERWVLWHAACVGSLDAKRDSLMRIEKAAQGLHPHSENVCV